MIFLGVALAFGVIQILFGIGVEMYEQLRSKNFATAFASQFPYLMLLPGALIWIVVKQGGFNEQIGKGGLFLIIFGIGVMIIVSLFKKGRNPFLNLIINIGGLLWKAKDFLGNILSYSRLMALGLTTGVIAFAVNIIARNALQIPYLGILIALCILVVGHMFNIAISTLGAFVHTTRLQFVEFFSYFFQGGGEAFEPLAHEGKYVITKKGGK